jgi:hypothetical protein
MVASGAATTAPAPCTNTGTSGLTSYVPSGFGAHYGFAGYPGGPTSGIVSPSYSLSVYNACNLTSPTNTATDAYARTGLNTPFYSFGYTYPINPYTYYGLGDSASGTSTNTAVGSTTTTASTTSGGGTTTSSGTAGAPAFQSQTSGPTPQSQTTAASTTTPSSAATANLFNTPGNSAVYYPSVPTSAAAPSGTTNTTTTPTTASNVAAPAANAQASTPSNAAQPTAGTVYGGFASYPGGLSSGAAPAATSPSTSSANTQGSYTPAISAATSPNSVLGATGPAGGQAAGNRPQTTGGNTANPALGVIATFNRVLTSLTPQGSGGLVSPTGSVLTTGSSTGSTTPGYTSIGGYNLPTSSTSTTSTNPSGAVSTPGYTSIGGFNLPTSSNNQTWCGAQVC